MARVSRRDRSLVNARRFAADSSIEARIGKRITVDADGCWIMDGKPDRYAQLKDESGTVVPAHRWMFEFWVKPIAPLMQVHHYCEKPGCVNPEHLTAVYPQQHRHLHQAADFFADRPERSTPTIDDRLRIKRPE